jgi:hypothetical protein
MECYHFEERRYNDGLFNDSIDATYIIHLKGNGRLSDINQQLEIYHPTNIVYILFNKGYKKCKKEGVDTPAKDLTDAFLTIFKDAKQKKYNNILILEDDFMFSPKVKESIHIKNINHFLNKHKNSDIQYLLGTLPGIRMPYIYDTNHSMIFISAGTHSVVYTHSNREKILLEKKEDMLNTDWDSYSSSNNVCYGYHIPLCYQLFPDTENKKTWGSQNIFTRILGIMAEYIFNCLNLDKKVEPGYSYSYTFSLFTPYLLFFILIGILMAIYNLFLYKSYKPKKSSFRILSRKK